MNQRVIITTRQRLEAKIEELIGFLDLLDGDPDFEDGADDEDGADAEPEETDLNGDEEDGDKSEDDTLRGGWFIIGKLDGGSGL